MEYKIFKGNHVLCPGINFLIGTGKWSRESLNILVSDSYVRGYNVELRNTNF